jgi:hypothetical protein
MAVVPPASIPIALDKCDPTAFEKYSQTVFGAVLGQTFKPLPPPPSVRLAYDPPDAPMVV